MGFAQGGVKHAGVGSMWGCRILGGVWGSVGSGGRVVDSLGGGRRGDPAAFGGSIVAGSGTAGETAVGAGTLGSGNEVGQEKGMEVTVKPEKATGALPVEASGLKYAAGAGDIGPSFGGP